MTRPMASSPRPPRRSSTRGDRLLHHLGAVLSLAGQGRTAKPMPGRQASSTQRRRRQRLSIAQRLLDPLPAALRPADRGAERFWEALRWGGVGILLAWWLSP